MNTQNLTSAGHNTVCHASPRLLSRRPALFSIVIVLALTTGGGWIYSRKVRRLANDEVTRSHRDQAFRVGFLATMAACVALYVLSMFERLGGREAVHLVMTVGIAATLIWFAVLERRALRDG